MQRTSLLRQACSRSLPAGLSGGRIEGLRKRRLDITKSKVIQATYKGHPLKSTSGKDDFCADYEKRAAEFDKCGK